MSEIKPWREYIGKHEAYMIMCDVLNALCEKEAIKKTVYERLRQAPSTDRNGQWIMKTDPYGFFEEIPVCSECGHTTEMRKTYNFCPNCGADMRGEIHAAD